MHKAALINCSINRQSPAPLNGTRCRLHCLRISIRLHPGILRHDMTTHPPPRSVQSIPWRSRHCLCPLSMQKLATAPLAQYTTNGETWPFPAQATWLQNADPPQCGILLWLQYDLPERPIGPGYHNQKRKHRVCRTRVSRQDIA